MSYIKRNSIKPNSLKITPASALTDSQLVEAKNMFSQKSRDGQINISQITDGFKEYKFKKSNFFSSRKRFIKEQYDIIDKNKKGYLEYEDFKELYATLINSELFTIPEKKAQKPSPLLEITDTTDKKKTRKPSFVERKFNPFGSKSAEKSSLTSSISTTFLPTGHRITFSGLSSSSSTIGLPTFGSVDKSIVEVEVVEIKKGEKFFHFDPNSSQIPSAIVHLTSHIRLKGLNTAGLFRISGTQSNVLALKKVLDAGKYPSLEEYEIHDICSTLKLWLRQMQQPLLTFNLYEPFMAATNMTESEEERLECIRKVVEELPIGHKSLLKYLVEFLIEVTEKSEQNLMNSSNLAIVFTPTCFRPQTETIQVLFGNSTNSNSLFESFITDYKTIFLPRDKAKRVTLTSSQAQFVCGTISRATSGTESSNHNVPSWDNFFSNPNTPPDASNSQTDEIITEAQTEIDTETETSAQSPQSKNRLSKLYSMADQLLPSISEEWLPEEENTQGQCTVSTAENP